MKYNIFDYKSMRFKKYYDAIKTNKSFMKVPLKQKYKILVNILKYFAIASKKPGVIKNKPVTLQLEPTSLCNLHCDFCIRYAGNVPIGTMSFENFKKILDKLDSLYKIGISGQGELFLTPDIFNMIKYANEKGMLVHINSNGTLLTKEIIDKICKLEIGEIGISVDSTDKREYQKMRRGANFDKLMENIKNLTDALKKNKKETKVTICAIIFKKNIEELPKFIELAKKVGVDKVAFQTLQTKEDYMESYGKRVKAQIVSGKVNDLVEKMEEARELANKYGITIIFDEEESPGCIWPWRSIYVTWEGEVTPCCKVVETKKTGSLGNVLKQDFWEVWNGERYQELRKLLRERKTPIVCRGCNRV